MEPLPLESLLVIGNQSSRRVRLFTEVARRLVPVQVVSYGEWLDEVYKHPPTVPTLVRLESPGECDDTFRRVLTAGIPGVEQRGKVPISAPQIADLTIGKGEILHPLQWYLGFRHILQHMASLWNVTSVQWMSRPESIATTFDKLACLQVWSAAGLPQPRRYEGIARYDQLRAAIPDRHARIFVKPRYGYSALGAMAIEWRDERVRAITTVDVTWSDGRPRLYLTKRPQVLQREFQIAWLFDTLAMEDVVIEDWLPKMRIGGKNCDLRVVTINGRVQHVVGRASSSPFTNLNLDAQRVPRDVLQRELGGAWDQAVSLCEEAAAQFPDATVLGIDLLVKANKREFALLEANAFGDYLPGITHMGKSTYEAELAEFRDQFVSVDCRSPLQSTSSMSAR